MEDAEPATYISSVGLTLPPALDSAGEEDNSSEAGADDLPEPPRPLLFAQSAASYPIVKLIAPPPQPGQKVNGTFSLTDDVSSDTGLAATNQKLSTLDQMQRHTHKQLLIDPPSEKSMRIGIAAPESTEAQLDQLKREREEDRKSWWKTFVWELVCLVVVVVAVYRWAFSKATKAAAASNSMPEKIDNVTTLVSAPTEEEKRPTTPVVRFEALPDLGNMDLTTPKKKSTRRRVRGKKKRRGSVGPADEGDGGDSNGEQDAGSPPPSEASGGSKDDKQVVLPRSTSSVSLSDEHERLAISDTVIGFGSHGTVVLKGTWGGRPVAVKRLLSDFVRLASQEVKLLQASDDHPNVIRYYCQERRDNFLYIALDLCQASLADIVESPDRHMDLATAFDRKKAMLQITAGVKHLHAMKIIHRDIKPQ